MRVVPELVFVNCCHLAARNVDQLLAADAHGGYDRVRFASGVAEELIKIGVRVRHRRRLGGRRRRGGNLRDDLLQRRCCAATVSSTPSPRRARRPTTPTNNTWAAYQCYGDPGLGVPPRWRRREARRPRGRRTSLPASRQRPALKLALETIVVQTKFQRYKPEAQLERVRALEQRFGERWGQQRRRRRAVRRRLRRRARHRERDPLVRARGCRRRRDGADEGGRTAGERADPAGLRDGREGAEAARRGSGAAQGRQPRTPRRGSQGAGGREARGRRRGTCAPQVARVGAGGDQEAGSRCSRSWASCTPTMERESLRGSAYKRLALIAAAAGQPAEERRAIEATKAHYARAAAIGRESQASNVFYPGLNYLAAELALNAGRRGWKGVDNAIVEATKQEPRRQSRRGPRFLERRGAGRTAALHGARRWPEARCRA